MSINSELEFPACPLCESELRKTVYPGFGQHNIVQCGECSFHYLYPRLTQPEIIRFYERDSYYSGGDSGYSDTGYADQEPALRATFKVMANNLQRGGLAGGDLLEVGCGFGYFLQEARPFFKRRVGTEFSVEGVQRTAQLADAVYVGGIDAVPDSEKFDTIISLQVVEHVYNPAAFITDLIRHCNPGGTVILGTPDIGGLLKKVMGRRWPSFKAPEHVLYFDKTSLSATMERAGLTNIKRLPYPHAFPVGLIAAKLGLHVPAFLKEKSVWVPATSIALSGKVPS